MDRNKELKVHRLRLPGRSLCSIRSNRKWCKRRGSSLQCQNCFFVYSIIDSNLKNLLLQLQRLPAQARKTQKTLSTQPSHRSKKCLLQATRYSLSVSALLKPVSVEREPQRIPVPARRSPFRQLRLRHLKQARLSRMPSISKPNYQAKGTAIISMAVPF